MRVLSTILIGLTATNVATAFTISSPLYRPSTTATVGIKQSYFQQQNVINNKPSSFSTTQLFMGWGPGESALYCCCFNVHYEVRSFDYFVWTYAVFIWLSFQPTCTNICFYHLSLFRHLP